MRRVAPVCPGTGNGPVSTIEWPECVRPPPPTGFAPTSRRSVKAKALRPGGFFVGGRKGALRFRKPEKSRPPTEALPLGASSAADFISPLRSAHRFSFEPVLSRGSASVGGSVSNFCGLPERSASVLKRPSLVSAHRGRSASLGRRTGKEVVQETNGEDGSAPGSLEKPGWERARGNEALRSVAVFPIFAGFQNEALRF